MCVYIYIYICIHIHTYITLHYITLHYITLHYIHTYITYFFAHRATCTDAERVVRRSQTANHA